MSFIYLPRDCLRLIGEFMSEPDTYFRFRISCRTSYHNLTSTKDIPFDKYLTFRRKYAQEPALRDTRSRLDFPNQFDPDILAQYRGSDACVLSDALMSLSQNDFYSIARDRLVHRLVMFWAVNHGSPDLVARLLPQSDGNIIRALVKECLRSNRDRQAEIISILSRAFHPGEYWEFEDVRACMQLDPNLMNLLISSRLVDVNEPDHAGRTLLMLAAGIDRSTVELLIQNRALVNLVDSRGNAVIHYLAMNEANIRPDAISEIGNALLHVRADFGIRNSFGDTPIDLAVRNDNSTLIEFLGSQPN